MPTLGFVFKGFAMNGKNNAFELRLFPDDYVLEFESNGMTDWRFGLVMIVMTIHRRWIKCFRRRILLVLIEKRKQLGL